MENNNNMRNGSLGMPAITIHLGLVILGITAWLTGELAGDYKRIEHTGFTIHKWLGMGLCFFVLLRILLGIFGPGNVRFTKWMPYTKERLLLVLEDISGLLKFCLPERQTHQGLAGVVQTFGVGVFLWMSLTGSLMFLYLEPGQKAKGMIHLIKEIHEIGELLIPVFLSLHIGAVILHALSGRHLWKKMFFIREKTKIVDVTNPDNRHIVRE